MQGAYRSGGGKRRAYHVTPSLSYDYEGRRRKTGEYNKWDGKEQTNVTQSSWQEIYYELDGGAQALGPKPSCRSVFQLMWRGYPARVTLHYLTLFADGRGFSRLEGTLSGTISGGCIYVKYRFRCNGLSFSLMQGS